MPPFRFRVHLALAMVTCASACQILPAATTSPQPPATGSASNDSLREASALHEASGTGGEVLRDPRERRLRHVRQLTRSRWVATPQFSADGRWLYVAERRPNGTALLRLSIAEPSKAPEEVAVSGNPWAVLHGKGGLCAVTTSKPCAGTGWPDPDSLLGCDQPALFPFAGDPAACPALRGPLPCALSMQGIEVCPARTASGIRLMLSKPSSPTPVPLGPADENSWMPALSPNGSRLVFVNQPTHAPSRLMVGFLDHADPQPEPLGPEAARTLDPTFNAAGDRVVFASTADDAGGKEVDLLMVAVIGGALERITFAAGTDRFPTFSPDGRFIAWVSERAADTHAQDLFIAEWVAEP